MGMGRARQGGMTDRVRLFIAVHVALIVLVSFVGR
jgi:hypothetical protein